MKTVFTLIALSLLGATVAAPAAEPAPAPAKKAALKPQATDKPAAADSSPVALDTTQITGNRELPRVLYVVPWKRADLGESSGKPVKSLLDEVLAPVDRDVFQRQNRYHEALRPDTTGASQVDAKVEPKVER